MRLRQAHAILEAATALEACGLGFELWPLHHDFPGAPRHLTRDSMSGFAEITDPDDDHIEAHLTFGLGPDPESLLYSKYSVALDTSDDERFRGLVGAQIAERIADEVRKHEESIRRA